MNSSGKIGAEYKILVTGGTGQVGRHLRELLPDAVYVSSKDYDLTSEFAVRKMIIDNKPDLIVHLAGYVAGISENIASPATYFYKNIMMNSLVVELSRELGVKRLIAIGSTCAYPDKLADEFYPMRENCLYLGPPTPTNFGYGYAKRCMSVHIDAVNKQYGLNYQYIIPPNLYGPYDKFDARSHYVGALLMKMLIATKAGHDHIELMGDGSPLRQFMYAGDLAASIFNCINSDDRSSFNIAPDYILSIKQIAELAFRVCDVNLSIEWNGKNNGQLRKDVSNARFREIYPSFEFMPFESGLLITWKHLNSLCTL